MYCSCSSNTVTEVRYYDLQGKIKIINLWGSVCKPLQPPLLDDALCQNLKSYGLLGVADAACNGLI